LTAGNFLEIKRLLIEMLVPS